MCNNLTQISQTYEDRAIFRCEHNTFHIVWDKSVVHLSFDELRYLYSLIEFAHADWKPSKQPNVHLFRRATPEGRLFFEVWVSSSGLRLSFKDVSILKNMLADVFAFLDNELPVRTKTVVSTRAFQSFNILSWN
ncbi:MAG: hypothetical protein HYZ22_03760 [Chloroflexi bacterium]|nr:hypothetical protein [Chloroflexota bacterium]